MMGWSTSPSTKSTTTSWPMRGRWTPPNWVPAPSIATRTQQELLASDWPSRSQWNWILTRPYLSGKISSPAGPTPRGGARAPDAGRRRDAWRAERQGDGYAGEGIGIFEGRGGVVGVVVDSEWLLGQVLDAGEHELAVVGKVAGQFEGVARGESAVLAFGSNEHAGGRLFLHADVGDALVLVEEVL